MTNYNEEHSEFYKILINEKILNDIKNLFINICMNSPLIKEIIKIEFMEKTNITEKEYNILNNDIINIHNSKKYNLKGYGIIYEKFELFMDRNKDISLNDIYKYLKKINIYNGDISCELIIVEPIKPKITPYFKY